MAQEGSAGEPSPVLVEHRGSLTLLTLNRPDKLNSFNEAQHRALKAAVDAAAADETCRAVIITGSGRGFCAGQDLSDRVRPEGGRAPDLGETLDEYYNPLIRAIRAMPKPVIAAVNGVAAGAGANLALACDLVLAARSAKFVQAFSKIGLIPDSGGTWMLPRLVGEARAKALTMLAIPVPAEEAERIGMIYRAVDDSALMSEAIALGEALAKAPTRGLAETKLLLQRAFTLSFDQQLDDEREAQRRLGRSADYAEGVRAFMEKREATFRGQ
uniref:Putative phenylacetate degradation enoyl-CoA hydratase PaaB n=1 Tax=uncultured bacterium CBNPD1 BAC clone 67 TaxID=417306 RepID=B1N6E6_9BACT|nr:putative phenylacetate degradation enoyl-CoA hydratase PaaB [uncultured bacterium CBNPD1 BAC clone 67]